MSYESFAYYYDQMMDKAVYEKWAAFILSHGKFNRLLDLGCGTGTLMLLLKNNDNQVTGADLSEDMLSIARYKAEQENKKITLFECDMAEFSIKKEFDLITCMCDSLNYLPNLEAVEKTFNNVYQALENNGTFIFDIVSLYYFQNVINDYLEGDVLEDFEYHWEAKLINDHTIHHEVVFKSQNNVFKEDHVQISFEVETIIELLKKYQFKNIEVTSDFENEYNPNGLRHFFKCTKEKI